MVSWAVREYISDKRVVAEDGKDKSILLHMTLHAVRTCKLTLTRHYFIFKER